MDADAPVIEDGVLLIRRVSIEARFLHRGVDERGCDKGVDVTAGPIPYRDSQNLLDLASMVRAVIICPVAASLLSTLL